MVEQNELMKTRRKLRMNRRDKRILTQFAKLVRQQFPEARMLAFGSRVKGTAHPGIGSGRLRGGSYEG